MVPRTPLCDMLAIDVPIFSVGFAISAGPELVAAVSNAGAFGVVGGTGIEGAELRNIIARTHGLTARPFGVNLIIADLDEPDVAADDLAFLDDQVDAALEAGVAAIVFFWGPVDRYVDKARAAGTLVALQVGSVEEGRIAAAAGADIVIAQGLEAGGHVRGRSSIWEVLPALVDALGPVPVLASGGIGDGAGIARALRAGAQGVSLGTRFVATDEAFIHPLYKRRVVESRASDTVYVRDLFHVNWPDAPHRVLRNRTVREWEAAGRPPVGQRPGEGTTIGTQHRYWGDYEWARYATGMVTPDFEGDVDLAPMWCGESCEVVNEVKPAAEVIADLVRDATSALASS
jgi:nitronate monooxygenase